MKTISILAAGAILALPTLAHAQWYAGADGGVNFLQDTNATNQDNGYSGKVSSDVGYVLLGHGGYAFGGQSFGKPMLEGEIAYRNSGLKSLTDSDGKLSGHTSALSFMTNGLYQFLPQKAWHPYVGAGIGMARIGIKWQDDTGSVSDTDWVFAYQGMAGVAYDLNKNWQINTQYRYFATQDPEFSEGDSGKIKGEYASQAIMAGITYRFSK